jgi:hypothetical protein
LALFVSPRNQINLGERIVGNLRNILVPGCGSRIQVKLFIGGSLETLATTLVQVADPRIQVKLVIGGPLETLAQIAAPRIQVKLGIGDPLETLATTFAQVADPIIQLMGGSLVFLAQP